MLTNRKKQAQITRQEILDAAEEVFHEAGLSGATLEAIAQRSGVTRGAIYWHFANKTEVFEAVFERTISFYEELFIDITQKATSLQEFEDFNIDLWQSIASDEKKQRSLCILLMRHEWLPVEKKIFTASQESSWRFLHLTEGFFSRMQSSRQLSDGIPSHALAKMFQFYTHGMLVQFLRHPETVDLEENARIYVQSFFGSLRASALQKQGDSHENE
jgi:TetR/AcrR family acrAB operon transcriptional repressor